MAKMWTVVKFRDEDAVEAVPSKWILNNQCYWPPFSKEKLITAIKKNEEPNTHWPLHDIVPLRNSSYDDYLVARNKCKKAEETSDLNSADELSRRIRRTKRFSTSSSDETESNVFITNLVRSPPKLINSDKRTQQINNNILKEGTAGVDCTCCPIHGCSKVDEYFEDMIKKLNILRVALKQVGDDVNNIQVKINLGVENLNKEVTPSLFQTFTLPLKTVEELTALEEHLLVEVNFNIAITELSKIGGNNTYDFVRRCLTLLITNELAEEYSWHGMRKKREFGTLKLASVMLKSSDINNKATNKETEEATKKWLRRAKERREGKKNKE